MSADLLAPTKTAADVSVGDRLEAVSVPITPTLVVSTALATRDFQDVHHDRDLAQSRGSKDIFLNILTSTGLVQRFVTDWAGPEALVRGVSVRLGAPCYPYDTLRFVGEVTDLVTETAGAMGPVLHIVKVTGKTELGDHVVATVRLQLPVREA
ncbi:MAG TPA: MaoC/PaaZ C-terminal domain-containing protein [Nocardioidaceae bacterium]|nr:MaoC/PaaZ C-terminal domain-containing protein [Nocardioidaceae bacterium]